MKVSVSNVVFGLILLFAGYALGQEQGPVQIQTVRDTLAIGAYESRLKEARIENDGLRSRLENVETRAPDTIYHVDTLVTPPDTVFEFVTVRDGRVSAGVLVRPRAPEPDSIPTGLYAPEFHAGTDVSDCDEGFEVSAAGVICDRPTFGHLWLGPWLNNTDPMAAAWWKPTYRSPWEAWVGYGRRIHFGVRRGLEVF